MAWILRLVKIGAEGEGRPLDVMEIDRPDDLRDIADLGLRLDETKRLLAGLQQEIVAAQVRQHAARRPAAASASAAAEAVSVAGMVRFGVRITRPAYGDRSPVVSTPLLMLSF